MTAPKADAAGDGRQLKQFGGLCFRPIREVNN
jgi:hypothetical protein